MAQNELELSFFNYDFQLPQFYQVSINDDQPHYYLDFGKPLNECAKIDETKLKTTAKNVMRKIKLMAKGLFVDDNLPHPDDLPTETTPSEHVNTYNSNHSPQRPSFSVEFEATLKEEVLVNNSISNKGFCIAYRDIKAQNYRVNEISNEFSCRGFFEWFSCYHLMPDSARIVIFDHKLKVGKAYQFLQQCHVRAAPVWDSDQYKLVSMLTITDFIKFLRKHYATDPTKIDQVENNTIQDWHDNMEGNRQNASLISVSPECNLKYAVYTIRNHNIHRLPIIDPINGNLLSIITNSQLFRFFYRKYIMEFNLIKPNYMQKTPINLGLGQCASNVTTIHPWQTLYEAFDVFIHNQISVLPVVDKEGRLLDIYARYDVIALIEINQFKNLDLTIAEALKLRKLKRPPCTCNKDNSLQEIIELIYEAQ